MTILTTGTLRTSTFALPTGWQYTWYVTGNLWATNAFDTKVRLGTVDNSTQALSGGLWTDLTEAASLIYNIADTYGYNIYFHDDWNYTYLDLLTSEGRGETDGLYTLDEADLDSLEISTANKPRVHSLITTGVGWQSCSPIESYSKKGVWLFDKYQVENGFLDDNGILIPYANWQYNKRQNDASYRVTTPRKLLMNPGDFIKLKLDKEQEQILSSHMIETGLDKRTTLELGARRPDFKDAWIAKSEPGVGYTSYYMLESYPSTTQSCIFKPSDRTHNACAPGVMTFAVPPGCLDANLKPRVTLDLSLDWKDKITWIWGRWDVDFQVNGYEDSWTIFPQWRLGETFEKIDITDLVTAGVNNTVNVYATLIGDFSEAHSDCTGHADLSCSATMNFWKRLY